MNPRSHERNKHAIVLFICALLAGFWARINNIWDQVLLGDEWHAIHQIANSQPSDFIFSFGHSDHSIPLTAFYWILSKTIGLNELLMRIPMIVSGMLLLVLWYKHIRSVYTERVAIISLWLLALSPVLIQYSRTARPYILTLTLLFVSYWLFEKCRNKPLKYFSARYLAYALSTSVAVWLHLTMLPFVVAPYMYKFFDEAINGRLSRKVATNLFMLGLPVGILTCLLIMPPAINDYASLAVTNPFINRAT